MDVSIDELMDAIIVIVVAVAALIARWHLAKKRGQDGPNGPLT